VQRCHIILYKGCGQAGRFEGSGILPGKLNLLNEKPRRFLISGRIKIFVAFLFFDGIGFFMPGYWLLYECSPFPQDF
jgi:hypothetical protein